MKKFLFLVMFPTTIFCQSLNYTKWDVTIDGFNQIFYFFNDTIKISSFGSPFTGLATYQDSSNFLSVKDYLDTTECGSHIGIYNYQISNDSLHFNLNSDTCSGRVYFFINSIWESINTGFPNESKLFDLKTYPNPVKEIINIEINNYSGNIQTEVFDLIGNKLQTTNETTISLRDYSNGIYIFKVAYCDRVEEVKVIKE